MSNDIDNDYSNIDVLLETLLDYENPTNNELEAKISTAREIQKEENEDSVKINPDISLNNSSKVQHGNNDVANKILFSCGQGLGKMCKCSLKCPEKISIDEIYMIYKDFCNLDNYARQNSYLSSCIKSIPIKRRRRSGDPKTFYKQNTFIYSVKINERYIRLCKTAFMSVHGLQKNRGRVNNILTMVKCTNFNNNTQQKNSSNEIQMQLNVEEPVVPLYYACDLDELINTGNLVTVYMISLAQNINNSET